MLGTTETLDNPDTIDKESLNGKPCQDEFLVEDFLVVDIAWPKRRSLAKFAEATDTAIQLKSKYTQILFLFSTPCVDAKTGSPSFSCTHSLSSLLNSKLRLAVQPVLAQFPCC